MFHCRLASIVVVTVPLSTGENTKRKNVTRTCYGGWQLGSLQHRRSDVFCQKKRHKKELCHFHGGLQCFLHDHFATHSRN